MKRRQGKPATLSAQLREIIEAWPESRYRISLETGISQATLSRFVNGKRGLPMDAVDTLSLYLELKLTCVSQSDE
jgi:hypothetical protein